MKKVFVYGSLLQGFGNHVLLEDAEFVGESETEPKYDMVSLGGFPGVLEGGETAIKGEVYQVDDKIEARLDCLEGVCHENPSRGLYRKHEDTLIDGQEVTLYIYNGSRGGDCIESGSWRQYVAEKGNYYRRYG